MEKPLDQSRIIPTETNCVISYHYFNTSVESKAKSNSGDRYFFDPSISLVIPLCLLIPTKNRSPELDFAFGSTGVLKQLYYITELVFVCMIRDLYSGFCIFFVLWVLVVSFAITWPSKNSFSNPLVIPQGK